jgi:protoheme IX farnesyltransferase
MSNVAAEQIISPSKKPSPFRHYMELTKARLTMLVLFTTIVGFYMGLNGEVMIKLLFHTLFGTALVAGGAAVLNQYLEQIQDSKMKRTQNRPIPTGEISAIRALIIGSLISVVGLADLYFFVNHLSAVIATLTLFSYLFVYTPMKLKTSLNTIIGAIPGALPPMIGWAAVQNKINIEAWVLFAIIFLWQMPHFLAISWLYREDYKLGGFKMLTAEDVDGTMTGRQSFLYALALIPVSMLPWMLGMVTWMYFMGAFALGAFFAVFAFKFMRERTSESARRLFLGSITYLPLLFGVMIYCKTVVN